MATKPAPAEVDPKAARSQPSPAPKWVGPFCGLLAAAVAVCVGLLVAVILDVTTPLDAVGSEFIDHTPKWLKMRAIDWFGANDKFALRIGMVATISLFALGVGTLARRWPKVGPAVIGLFGGFGAIVAIGRPAQGAKSGIPALVGAMVGAVVIWYLIGVIWYLIGVIREADPVQRMPGESRIPRSLNRRRFVIAAGTAAASAVVATVAARQLENRRLEQIRDTAPNELPPVATEVSLGGEGGVDSPRYPCRSFAQPDNSVSHAKQGFLSHRHRAFCATHSP